MKAKLRIRRDKKFWPVRPEMEDYDWGIYEFTKWWEITEEDRIAYAWETARITEELPVAWVASWDLEFIK